MNNKLDAEHANQHISDLLYRYRLLEEERLKHYHNWNRFVFRWKQNDLFEPLLKGLSFGIPATGLLLQLNYGMETFSSSGALLIIIAIFIGFLQAYDNYLYSNMREIKFTAAFHFLQAMEYRNRNKTIELLGEANNSIDETLATFFEDDVRLRQAREVDGSFYSSIELWLVIFGTLIWAVG